MLQTSARIVMTGVAAVTLGALSGWVLIDKLHPSTASAASIVAPAPSVNADGPIGPKPESVATTPAPASPPAATDARKPAPTRVAAPTDPAPTATPAPAKGPDSATPTKPRTNVDKDRREANIDVGKDGKQRIKTPNGDFSIDRGERGGYKVRGPMGNFDIDW